MNPSVRGTQHSLVCCRAVVCFFSILLLALQVTTNSAQDVSSNSIVRFEFIQGTNALGNVDVELFDRDKPETVRNFLLYVRSGAYTNSFLHRLVPGFVVQGGGFAVTNPLSADRFSTFLSITNYGQVTNEFSVGPRLSNSLGTIAMAKIGNDPNSASSQWFFNLGNNSTNLDNQNGGFTVFGRVLETGNTNEGLNVLQHFNQLSTNAGIVNLGALISTNYGVFNALPVAYTNSVTRVPNNRELYFVRISLLNNIKPPGISAPTITITSPAANSAFTNQAVRVQGTASDDIEVARVVYRVGDGPRQGAIGTTSWALTLEPTTGFQAVTVESIDFAGNHSPPASVNFFFQRTIPLDLRITGQGTVTGVANGQGLNVNGFYTATANPLPGNIFEGWSGSITSSTPTLTFQAPATGTNFTLIAKFIAEPLPTLVGTYQGLFQTLGPTDFDGAGFMGLALEGDGFFSGSIQYHGITYYYTGKFDEGGNATLVGNVGGVPRTISLTLQKLTSAGLITGTFSGTSSTTLIQLERLASSLPTANAPAPGNYTFVIPLNATNTPSSTVPGGHGVGTGAISAGGLLTLSGVLGDGTSFTAAQQVTRLGRWPLFVDLDGGRGALWGWITYNTNQTQKLEASLTWLRPASGSAPFYPGGVTNQVNFAASRYSPEPGKRALNWVHGLVRLTGTDLPSNFTNVVKLTSNNTFEVLEPNSGSLRLTLEPSGRVTGSFVNPFFGTVNLIQGALLTASNYIRGQYISGSEIGSITIDISPLLVAQTVQSTTLPALLAAMNEGGILRFQSDGEIVLVNALVPKFNTHLDANGHSIVIRGAGQTRLIEVPTNLTFSATGITFAGGFHQGANGVSRPLPDVGGDGFGGGIMSLGGPVALTNCTIRNCVVRGGDAAQGTSGSGLPAAGGRALGAALYTRGAITLQNCTISENFAFGGGNRTISTAGAISRGDAMAMGAGLFSEGGECRITDCTFMVNQAHGGQPLPLSSTANSRGGNAAGGAIALTAGSLVLNNSTVYTNRTFGAGAGNAYAGGLFLETNVVATVEKTRFELNFASAGTQGQSSEAATAEGGAIFNAGSLTLRDCTLELNRSEGGLSGVAGSGRGGALASTGPVVVNTSTFSENSAGGGGQPPGSIPTSPIAGGEGAGGAIFIANNLNITNSTFAHNRAIGGSGADPAGQTSAQRGLGRGGAVFLSGSSAVLANVTLAFNAAVEGSQGVPGPEDAAGGAFLNQNGSLSLRSSVVASNSPANFFGAITDLGYNISSDASFALSNTGSLTNKDPVIAPLSTNGGPTRTIAILAESPARDAVRGAFPSFDQRGIGRPQGSFADSGAFEYVQTLPLFSVQPSGTNTVRLGTNVTYQATVSGPEPIGFFWLKDGVQITGAISNVLTLTNIQPSDAGQYAIVATNTFGAVTSTVATVIVDLRPVILAQPPDIVVSPGVSTSLVVNAAGPSLSYTWFRDQVLVPGATNAAFVINSAAQGAEGLYQVIITNFAGAVTSRVATVTWSAQTLTILTQPQSQTVGIDSPVTLTVLASGVIPIGYQWVRNNVPIAGETNTTLSFPSIARTNSGNFHVIVRNPFVSLTSTTAVLTVVAPPLLSMARASSTVTITAFGDPGRVHRLQSSTNLNAGSEWVQVGTHTMPGSGSATWNLSTSTNTGAVFFRVVTP